MMGTLAAVLAGKNIETSKDRFRAEVKGDIEDVEGVLKITRIQVDYFLKAEKAQQSEAREALDVYLPRCPGAQSVIGCIQITHDITFE
ncbi:MAG: OsmC family protein [Pseudomonadota bacterium]